MSSKCDIIGHQFKIIDEDPGRTREECEECGYRETFFKQNVTGTDSKESQQYMEGHKRDFIQPSQTKKWEMAGYKKQQQDFDREQYDEQIEEAQKETERIEREKHAKRVSKVVWN